MCISNVQKNLNLFFTDEKIENLKITPIEFIISPYIRMWKPTVKKNHVYSTLSGLKNLF